MNTIRKILERLFPRLRYRRLQSEWSALVAAEILTDDPREAKFIVYQRDGNIRLVADRLFARNGDFAVATSVLERIRRES